MHQALDQQDVLAANIRFMAEEYFHNLSRLAALLLAVFGLDELADHWNLQRAHQVGHENESILQDGKRLDGLSPVVVGDVASKLLHALLDLLGGNDLAKWFGFRLVHEVACPPKSCAPQHPAASPASAPLPLPLWRAISPEPEIRASTRSRLRLRRPAKACARAAPHAVPAAVL